MNESAILDVLLLREFNIRVVVIGSVLLGIGSAVIGCFAFLRKRSLVGDAVAHSALPGVAVAFMVTGSKDPIALLIGAAVAGWISMMVMDAIVRNSRIREDASIGLVLSVFFGLGILLLTRIQQSGAAEQAGLDKFLFGQAASLVTQDVTVFGAVSVLLLLMVFLLYKEFKIVSFDPEFARALGLPVRAMEVALTTLLVFAVVVGIQAVGVVLMAAMLITPAAAARYWTERLPVMLALAALFGAVSGYSGALVSYLAPRMPTGPWIVTTGTLIFVASLLFAPQRGVAARLVRNRSNRRRTLGENILKTMYHISELDGKLDAGRTLDQIRERRNIPPRTARVGLKRLRSQGYVEEVSGDCWRLTPDGVNQGRRVTRLHRLWEVYLTQYVQIAPDHVHDDAESIEHVLTPELEEQLQSLLDRPVSDPHQRRIPYR